MRDARGRLLVGSLLWLQGRSSDSATLVESGRHGLQHVAIDLAEGVAGQAVQKLIPRVLQAKPWLSGSTNWLPDSHEAGRRTCAMRYCKLDSSPRPCARSSVLRHLCGRLVSLVGRHLLERGL